MPNPSGSELGDLEVRPSGDSCKSWDTVNMTSNASLFREKRNWGFPLNSKALCQGWGLCCERVSDFPTPFGAGIFVVTWCLGMS